MDILHSKIFGEQRPGNPLLVLHGLFGMLDNWATFGKIFGEDFPVHLIDLRNHGRSFHSDETTLDLLSDDILNYMDFHNLKSTNILGHSLGGKAAMQFAVSYPDRVAKLIIADIAPKAYPPHHQGIIKALQSIDFEKVNSRTEAEGLLANYIPEKSVIQFLAKNMYRTENQKLAWRFNLKVLVEKYSNFVSNAVKFGTYTGPTLFLRGEQSSYILPQDSFGIKQQFPNAQIVTIPNAGHWVQADNPAEFNREVSQFLIS